jgi:predicted phosphodiesterase
VRYAVLADIHGNLHALDAVLAALKDAAVDGYLVAGDLVGYGPFPNECVERVAELEAACIAGNHDLIILGQLSDERCIPLARTSLAWTREVLRDDVRAYLERLPRLVDAGRVVVTHGSLNDPSEYTRTPEQAVKQLGRLEREHPDAGVLVVGHTHRPWTCDEAGRARRPDEGEDLPLNRERLLLNPGAVGQSRELRVRARYLLLDLEQDVAQFRAVRYNTAACREALRANGLSPRSNHLLPTVGGAVRRVRGAIAGRR